MNASKPSRAIALLAAISVVGLSSLLVGCDRETSTSKSSSSKVVDTPDGKKKVTETTETKTTTEKK
jgi:hypothetical protein